MSRKRTQKKQQQQQQQKKTTKPGEAILSSPDSITTTTSSSNISNTADDDTGITNMTATPPNTSLSLHSHTGIASGLTFQGSLFGNSTSSTGTTTTDRFFDQAPDELNTRFPVGGHDLLATAPPEDCDSSSLSFLASPYLLRHRRGWHSVESGGVTWKQAVVANLAVLVAVGGFTVIMYDGVRCIAGLVWEMFCGLVGRLMD